MKKIRRDLSTPEAREFWRVAEESAREVGTWPDWKRAGINVTQSRETSRHYRTCEEGFCWCRDK